VSAFKDHFSGHAEDYASYRPTYPPELFASLASLAPSLERAWDVATGSGQAALLLADHFGRVIATDGSVRQLTSAQRHDRVIYAAALAERAPLPAGTVDLTVVAQALHWFDARAFYDEVRRVSVSGALFAAVVYTGFRVTPAIDRLTSRFYDETLRSFWPPERVHVESAYETLPFPFERVALPRFSMQTQWDFNALLSYIRTWSALKRFIAERQTDPSEGLAAELAEVWGDRRVSHRVDWDLRVLAGRL
jgi:ubiquinone/menaquinone biosynthesis C-methylase UbiE